MKNNKNKTFDDSVRKLEKIIDKNDKKVIRCAKVSYTAVALLGLAIFVGLPIGIFAPIPTLTIVSGAFAGLQVANQIIGLAFGSYYNNKSMNAQEELMKLYAERDKANSIEKGVEDSDEQTIDKSETKTGSKKRTKKVNTEIINDNSVTIE